MILALPAMQQSHVLAKLPAGKACQLAECAFAIMQHLRVQALQTFLGAIIEVLAVLYFTIDPANTVNHECPK